MPRNTYLVCYDICEDTRLRTLFKTMRDFGDHLQYSIFECQFTPPTWPAAGTRSARSSTTATIRSCSSTSAPSKAAATASSPPSAALTARSTVRASSWMGKRDVVLVKR